MLTRQTSIPQGKFDVESHAYRLAFMVFVWLKSEQTRSAKCFDKASFGKLSL